ncbi:hypothetical protein PPERSA_08733 [Pseudocohnilembus persalinus]|uniref:Derlin n=1 Tax=Pseudocohnilembus persalinus TaxID=266149 RepID=A0A0V0QYD0_PSEPJ|nr:hypothetical protein PPERSA_08733 [Pseudocohnilembus persalinus]|eukprot:KRX07056.1 hypothetical protein PPERSA_08733 [Pseudocohnilembus persalinus]
MFGQRPQAGGSGDCAQDVKNWWKNCPFFYKFVFCTSIFMFLCIYLLPFIPYLFYNSPYRTVQNFFFWTPFTTFLVPRDIFSLLIGVYLVYRDGKMIEQRIGSVHYGIELFFKNFLIQLGYIIIMYLGYFLFSAPALIVTPSLGLFPTFMMFLALRGLADPEQQTPFCCFPVLIKQKYYVWILYGIFVLLSQSLVPDILSAIGVAYLEVHVFNGQILKISQEKLKRLENSFIFSKISQRSDFVTVEFAGSMNLDAQLPVQQQQQEQQPQSHAFSGRGVQIGQQAGNISQNPPTIINPSLNQNNYDNQNQNQQYSNDQNEIRRAAAEAAQRRFEQEQEQREKEQQEQQQQEQAKQQEDSAKKNQKDTKKGYNKFDDEENQNQDLI